jgi:hypothetical protein
MAIGETTEDGLISLEGFMPGHVMLFGRAQTGAADDIVIAPGNDYANVTGALERCKKAVLWGGNGVSAAMALQFVTAYDGTQDGDLVTISGCDTQSICWWVIYKDAGLGA